MKPPLLLLHLLIYLPSLNTQPQSTSLEPSFIRPSDPNSVRGELLTSLLTSHSIYSAGGAVGGIGDRGDGHLGESVRRLVEKARERGEVRIKRGSKTTSDGWSKVTAGALYRLLT